MTSLPDTLVALADLGTLGGHLLEAVAAAWRGGLRWVILRAPAAATEERVRLGRELLTRCPGLFLSMHGDPGACRLLGAPGLHLPSLGFDLAANRRSNPSLLLGSSCHDAAEIAGAEAAGADYGFLSPLFRPTSKADARKPLGVEGFQALARATSLRLLALGGLRPDRLRLAAGAGAAGAAVLGALFLASDPEASAREFRAEADAAFARPGSEADPPPVDGGTPR